MKQRALRRRKIAAMRHSICPVIVFGPKTWIVQQTDAAGNRSAVQTLSFDGLPPDTELGFHIIHTDDADGGVLTSWMTKGSMLKPVR